MTMTRDRLQSIGWVAVLLVCFALLVALTFRVNAVKSQVRLSERQIAALKHNNTFLETEFETRANQQQLRTLNDVDFGYKAPTAQQYIEGERQLAMLGQPAGPGSPDPIRVAAADPLPPTAPVEVARTSVMAMVSPLTGKAMAAEAPQGGARRNLTAASLGDRLGNLERGRVRAE